MSFFRRIILVACLFLFPLSLGSAASAQAPSIDCGQPGVLIGCNNVSETVPQPSDSRFTDLIGSVISTIISLFALLAVVFVVKGGITLITSLGNDEKMKKARNTILYALLGLFLSTLAYLIVSTVTRIQLF